MKNFSPFFVMASGLGLTGIGVGVSAQEAGQPPCNICGEGSNVTLWDADVAIPSQPVRNCSVYYQSGQDGLIRPDQCDLLREFIEIPCGCSTPLLPGQARDEMGNLCYTSLDTLQEAEADLTDFNSPREYLLCPNTEYSIGVQNDAGEYIGGQAPIQLNTNMVVKCGYDGRPANNCKLTGGSHHVVMAAGQRSDNAIVQGVTFDGASSIGIVLLEPGKVLFKNCVVKNMKNVGPVVGIVPVPEGNNPPTETQSFGGRHLSEKAKSYERVLKDRLASFSGRQAQENEENEATNTTENTGAPEFASYPDEYKLFVTFMDVIFEDNTGVPIDEDTRAGVVTFVGPVIPATFENCKFSGNDYSKAVTNSDSGWAISTGSPLAVDSTCFVDNKFESTVIRVDRDGTASFSSTNSYIDEDVAECDVLQFPVVDGEGMCLELENSADICARITDAPSMAPVLAPASPPAATPVTPPAMESAGAGSSALIALGAITGAILIELL